MHSKLAVAAFLLAAVAEADPLKCGLASKDLGACPKCVETMASLNWYWWNWDAYPKIAFANLSPAAAKFVQKNFIPMLWGQGSPGDEGYQFLQGGSEWVMGYNEPDQFGPWCAGPATKGVLGCTGDGGDYRPASSDGWQPAFNPVTAAPLMQATINTMTVQPLAASGTVKKIAAPSMAQAAAPEDECTHDPGAGTGSPFCKGWMQGFKRTLLTLQCNGFDGKSKNCWDTIEAIPIHCYARTGAECVGKIQQYYDTFTEDFEGTNGRTKKTLWLTEVSAASNQPDIHAAFIRDLFSPTVGLGNRDKFHFVEYVTYFSDNSFAGFPTGSYVPAKDEMWSSSLFVPVDGNLTSVGQAFANGCSGKASVIV